MSSKEVAPAQQRADHVEFDSVPPFVAHMAKGYGVSPRNLWAVVKRQCIQPNRDGLHATDEQVIVFLQRARAHNLNPLAREIYGFIDSKGTLVCGVEIDGFLRIANSHPSFDGIEVTFEDDENGKPVSATCRVWREDRTHPITVTEYMDENRRSTPQWDARPRRMLRHKAVREAIRYAFGVQALDPEEAREAAYGVADERASRVSEIQQLPGLGIAPSALPEGDADPNHDDQPEAEPAAVRHTLVAGDDEIPQEEGGDPDGSAENGSPATGLFDEEGE